MGDFSGGLRCGDTRKVREFRQPSLEVGGRYQDAGGLVAFAAPGDVIHATDQPALPLVALHHGTNGVGYQGEGSATGEALNLCHGGAVAFAVAQFVGKDNFTTGEIKRGVGYSVANVKLAI